MRRYLRLFGYFSRNSVAEAMAHRWGAIAWVINGSIMPLITMMVWTTAGKSGSFAMGNSQIVTYFLLAIIVGRVTQSWSMEQMGEGIRTGEISNTFLRPYHYSMELMSFDIGQKTTRIMSLIPFMLLLMFGFRNSIVIPTWQNIVLLIPTLFMGYFLLFFLGCSLGTLSFWIDDLFGIERLWWMVSSVAAGVAIPLALMPDAVRSVLQLLPFRYYLSFPVEIALGQLRIPDILFGYLISCLWLISAAIIYILLDITLSKKYGAYGR